MKNSEKSLEVNYKGFYSMVAPDQERKQKTRIKKSIESQI